MDDKSNQCHIIAEVTGSSPVSPTLSYLLNTRPLTGLLNYVAINHNDPLGSNHIFVKRSYYSYMLPSL